MTLTALPVGCVTELLNVMERLEHSKNTPFLCYLQYLQSQGFKSRKLAQNPFSNENVQEDEEEWKARKEHVI